MNSLLRLVFIVCFVAIYHAGAAPAQDSAKVEAEISRLDTTRISALLKNDLKALDQLYADNMVYIHAGGRVDSKQQYLAMLSSGTLNYVALRYDPAPRILVPGPDTALVTGRATIET